MKVVVPEQHQAIQPVEDALQKARGLIVRIVAVCGAEGAVDGVVETLCQPPIAMPPLLEAISRENTDEVMLGGGIVAYARRSGVYLGGNDSHATLHRPCHRHAAFPLFPLAGGTIGVCARQIW